MPTIPATVTVRRRLALGLGAAALTATALTGCSAVDTALDCVATADAVATSISELQQAVDTASGDPTQLEESLASIDRNLTSLGDKTDNVDVSKAVDDLADAVAGVREASEGGDATPDLSGVTSAAGELTKVCTPG
ncbi:hypothetical protein [Streptomyces sp. NPDC060194]|uniref:hypothetical protein n=1 Tax=Streptomyces sp. NPDC060194 TaxID=3347069 RepID=UPI0036544B1B